MIPRVSGWIKLLAPVDLANAHPDPRKWDIKRPHKTMMVLVNREDGFKVMATPHSIIGYFRAHENPIANKIPDYLRHVAADELGVTDRRLKLDPRKFTLWECQFYCELPKPLDRTLDKKDQATLAGAFTDYEIFERSAGRVKMVTDTHTIYITSVSLALYPNNDKYTARDLASFERIAIKAVETLNSVVFD